jgi:hypothetical protein
MAYCTDHYSRSLEQLEVYENSDTIWKENAEWDADAGHRKLVPLIDDAGRQPKRQRA